MEVDEGEVETERNGRRWNIGEWRSGDREVEWGWRKGGNFRRLSGGTERGGWKEGRRCHA
jgi:hypothetical protein